MELILWYYLLPYDPKQPVICFDERPCFLIGDRVEPLPMEPGKVAKEHYGYEKYGCCSVLAAIEPKTGKRVVQVRQKRRKIEFALFIEYLDEQYPEEERIHLVLDNLNTHSQAALYEQFDAEKAARLARKFNFIFTPVNASWLNMIEIEFSALSRLCLNRRIPCMLKLEKEVLAFFKDRTEKMITINWQFTPKKARETLNRRYARVNPVNTKYAKT